MVLYFPVKIAVWRLCLWLCCVRRVLAHLLGCKIALMLDYVDDMK